MTTKTYRHLGLEQRYQIQALFAKECTQTEIASFLGVHKSTVCRELKRNSTRASKPPERYKPKNAQSFADGRVYKPPRKKSHDYAIQRRIVWLLKIGWSPQQIANTCCDRNVAMMSTEAIYGWIYELRTKGIQDLTPLLRRHHRKRRKRHCKKHPRTIIHDKVSIHDRPEVVNLQTRSGDLETDLVKCTNGYLLTVTDRKTLYNFIEKLPNKEAETIKIGLIKILLPLKGKIKTITSDNGTEFARHQLIAGELGIDWFFADPYSSQQRGCNENQNGLIRQYLTRKTDLNTISEDQLFNIQNKLNCRPRKKLNYKTPHKLFLQNNPVALGA